MILSNSIPCSFNLFICSSVSGKLINMKPPTKGLFPVSSSSLRTKSSIDKSSIIMGSSSESSIPTSTGLRPYSIASSLLFLLSSFYLYNSSSSFRFFSSSSLFFLASSSFFFLTSSSSSSSA